MSRSGLNNIILYYIILYYIILYHIILYYIILYYIILYYIRNAARNPPGLRVTGPTLGCVSRRLVWARGLVAWDDGRLAGSLAGWLAGWQTVWLAVWPAGCVAGWLAGRLAGWLSVWVGSLGSLGGGGQERPGRGQETKSGHF